MNKKLAKTNIIDNYNIYGNEKYKIIYGDCQDLLKKIPDEHIDLVVTDPPYFIDGLDNGWNDKKIRKRISRAGVVANLPVGMKFDRKQSYKLQKFMEPIAMEFYRLLKPGGFCIVFSQARLYHRMAVSLEDAGFEIRDMLAWKHEGQAKAFSQTHFIKRDKLLSEPEKEKLIRELDGYKTPQLKPQIEPMVMAQKPKKGTFVQNWRKYKLGLINTKESLDDKFPGNIMEISKYEKNLYGNMKVDHLTIKPVSLISHIIRLLTQSNQIVLDPFMGSGAHGVAAIINDRRFIGLECEHKYFQMARQALKNISSANSSMI